MTVAERGKRFLRRTSGQLATLLQRPFVAQWTPHSRLFFVSDTDRWVLAWEAREIAALARSLGIATPPPRLLRYARNQTIYFCSHLGLLGEPWVERPHRLAVAYFHGRPGSGEAIFDHCYEQLRNHHTKLTRIHVSHSEMRDVVVESGIDPAKVFTIPIAINPAYFPFRTDQQRLQARDRLGIPRDAVVVGSFQKDGDGWGEGLSPKYVKGPDVFLKAIENLHRAVPEVHVLLSGPARGYVKQGLKALRVPYTHRYVVHYPEISTLYHALDVYIVASRQEGGPKAVLESMACGVPLVTTRVGQAMDLVRHGVNGWMVDVRDAQGLAEGALRVIDDSALRKAMIAEGRRTAEQHTYANQRPLWQAFFSGFAGERAT